MYLVGAPCKKTDRSVGISLDKYEYIIMIIINLKMKLIIKFRTAFQSDLCKKRHFPKKINCSLKYKVSVISEQTVAGSFSAIEGAYQTHHTAQLRIALLDGIIFQRL